MILIIGILAAIAQPAFLGQRAKGQDSSAKSDARNMVSQVESCYATKQKWSDCTATTQGGVTVTSLTATDTGASAGFVITDTSDSGNTFRITRAGTTTTRSCTTTGGTTDGGCNSGSW